MPGWDGFDVPGFVRAEVGVDVFVDNDVNIMASASTTWASATSTT